MYHSPQTTTYRHYNSTDNTHLKVQPQDPLRQQLTSYLSHFRDEPVSSNLLINNGKALPTLYSKAKKYSLFTVKRKANRSFHSPFSSRPIEILPTLRRLKMWVILIILSNSNMNDLRLLLQADKDRKIINLEFKYPLLYPGKSTIWGCWCPSCPNFKIYRPSPSMATDCTTCLTICPPCKKSPNSISLTTSSKMSNLYYHLSKQFPISLISSTP